MLNAVALVFVLLFILIPMIVGWRANPGQYDFSAYRKGVRIISDEVRRIVRRG